MKVLVALFVAVVFAFSTGGFVLAQGQTTPKADKPGQAKVGEKKMAAKTSSGRVKSSGADSVVVAGTKKGKDAEWTFAIDSKTKIRKAGKNIAGADLKPGDALQVKYTEQAGKDVAQSISVVKVRQSTKAGDDKKAASPSAAVKPANKQ